MSLHPYYDYNDVEEIEWLYAELVAGSPITVRYYVSGSLPSVVKSRLNSHMRIYHLSELFSIKSAEEISGSDWAWKYIYYSNKEKGRDELQSYFQILYYSNTQYNKNSWKSALYRALSEQIDVYLTSL